MNPDIKSYLKGNIKGFLWSLVFPLIIYSLIKEKAVIGWFVVLDILGLIPGYHRYKYQQAYKKKLKDKGLTIEDISNIKFVKDWEDIRKKGLIKYSLVDGGIFFGFAMCGLVSLLLLFLMKPILQYVITAPSNMFDFIGNTYLAGALIGIIVYRFLWAQNERKFIRLTDPFR